MPTDSPNHLIKTSVLLILIKSKTLHEKLKLPQRYWRYLLLIYLILLGLK